MRARISVFLTSCLVIAGLSNIVTSQSGDASALRALAFFKGANGVDAKEILRAMRPPRADPRERARALAVLPETGELQPDRREREKLDALDAVVAYHDRTGAYAVMLIDVPQAAVGLHERALIFISRPALRIVSSAELQALVAHEIGHEYFWADFERTRRQRDKLGRRELELKCDGIAMLTLIGLGLDPTRLSNGLGKLTRFNERFGTMVDAEGYPTLDNRRRFLKDLRELVPVR
jgi:hypothetical protein